MECCDDCGGLYQAPAYYTFDEDSCRLTVGGVDTPHPCTGNICPQCAGPFMEPDMEHDPRKPDVDFYDERLHRSMEVTHGANQTH